MSNPKCETKNCNFLKAKKGLCMKCFNAGERKKKKNDVNRVPGVPLSSADGIDNLAGKMPLWKLGRQFASTANDSSSSAASNCDSSRTFKSAVPKGSNSSNPINIEEEEEEWEGEKEKEKEPERTDLPASTITYANNPLSREWGPDGQPEWRSFITAPGEKRNRKPLRVYDSVIEEKRSKAQSFSSTPSADRSPASKPKKFKSPSSSSTSASAAFSSSSNKFTEKGKGKGKGHWRNEVVDGKRPRKAYVKEDLGVGNITKQGYGSSVKKRKGSALPLTLALGESTFSSSPNSFSSGSRDTHSSEDDTTCEVCETMSEKDMLLCGTDYGEGCGRGFHIHCLSPPLKAVPEGDWFCSDCEFCEICLLSKCDNHGYSNSNSNSEDEEENKLHCGSETDGCGRVFHIQCMEPPLIKKPEGDWFCPMCDRDDVCEICSCSQEENMLLCGNEDGTRGCGKGFHSGCLNPPLIDIPEGDWYCSTCNSAGSSESTDADGIAALAPLAPLPESCPQCHKEGFVSAIALGNHKSKCLFNNKTYVKNTKMLLEDREEAAKKVNKGGRQRGQATKTGRGTIKSRNGVGRGRNGKRQKRDPQLLELQGAVEGDYDYDDDDDGSVFVPVHQLLAGPGASNTRVKAKRSPSSNRNSRGTGAGRSGSSSSNNKNNKGNNSKMPSKGKKRGSASASGSGGYDTDNQDGGNVTIAFAADNIASLKRFQYMYKSVNRSQQNTDISSASLYSFLVPEHPSHFASVSGTGGSRGSEGSPADTDTQVDSKTSKMKPLSDEQFLMRSLESHPMFQGIDLSLLLREYQRWIHMRVVYSDFSDTHEDTICPILISNCWAVHLGYSQAYLLYCYQICGHMIHRLRQSFPSDCSSATVNGYRDIYGELPPMEIWGEYTPPSGSFMSQDKLVIPTALDELTVPLSPEPKSQSHSQPQSQSRTQTLLPLLENREESPSHEASSASASASEKKGVVIVDVNLPIPTAPNTSSSNQVPQVQHGPVARIRDVCTLGSDAVITRKENAELLPVPYTPSAPKTFSVQFPPGALCLKVMDQRYPDKVDEEELRGVLCQCTHPDESIKNIFYFGDLLISLDGDSVKNMCSNQLNGLLNIKRKRPTVVSFRRELFGVKFETGRMGVSMMEIREGLYEGTTTTGKSSSSSPSSGANTNSNSSNNPTNPTNSDKEDNEDKVDLIGCCVLKVSEVCEITHPGMLQAGDEVCGLSGRWQLNKLYVSVMDELRAASANPRVILFRRAGVCVSEGSSGIAYVQAASTQHNQPDEQPNGHNQPMSSQSTTSSIPNTQLTQSQIQIQSQSQSQSQPSPSPTELHDIQHQQHQQQQQQQLPQLQQQVIPTNSDSMNMNTLNSINSPNSSSSIVDTGDSDTPVLNLELLQRLEQVTQTQMGLSQEQEPLAELMQEMQEIAEHDE